MEKNQVSIDEIYFAAIERETIEQRAEYLDEVCGADHELRARIERLLEAKPQVASFLEHPGPGINRTQCEDSVDLTGSQIGPYKLLEVIGEGGMGTVYMAKQTEPVNRRVALKLIKSGMDTRQVIARFEAERQAVALMDHPNIAKVLDAGATDSGRPFFVMELVKGRPITEFCDEQKLDLDARLNLFQQVCHAVQHAHQKGIIHRDIKPSNVLIALYDDKPVPKVIDFGVAKATGDELTEKTMFTRFGQIVGTLEYMSPEQAQFNQLDIDTRSDIYSLGAILYELLTGEPPFEREKIRNQPLDETLRMIRELEPTKPSTKLSGTVRSTQIASNRKTSLEKLGSILRGDLDWIVMKALEKDRTRRYETANGLALDIGRYLNDEPVSATPPSTVYRFRKFASRNKVALAFASVAGIGLLFFTIALAASNFLIREQKVIAEQEKRYAVAIADFVKNDILTLSTVHGQTWNDEYESIDLSKDSTLSDLLDRAAEKLESRTDLDPPTEAELSQIVGISLRSLGEYDRAIGFLESSVELFAQAYGENDPKTLDAKNSLAVAYQSSDKTIPLLQQTLASSKASLGLSHPTTIALMSNLAAEYDTTGQTDLAIKTFQQAFEIAEAEFGSEDKQALRLMGYLAAAYADAGQIDKSLLLLNKTVQLQKTTFGNTHPLTLGTISNLATVYRMRGQINNAIELLEESLVLQESVLEPNHPATKTTLKQLAIAYKESAQFEDAAVVFEKILAISRSTSGVSDQEIFAAVNDLALARAAAKQFEIAIPLFTESLDLAKANIGVGHRTTLILMENLAGAYRENDRFNESVSLFEETLRLSKAELGDDDPETLRRMNNLAVTYWTMNRLEDSIPAFIELVKIYEREFGPEHRDTIVAIGNLAVNYKSAGRLDEAVPLLEEVTAPEAVKKNFDLIDFRIHLIKAYVELDKAAEARALAEDHLTFMFDRLPADSPRLASEIASLCNSYFLNTNDFEKTEELLRKCVSMRKEKSPDHWTTFNAVSMLGEALMNLNQYDEAEKCLVEGHEGMIQRIDSIPGRSKETLAKSLQRLVTYYESGHDQQSKEYSALQAQSWREKLEILRQTEKQNEK